MKFLVAVSLIAFGHVGRNRQRRALNLVLHGEIATIGKRLKNIYRQATTALPNFQIFE